MTGDRPTTPGWHCHRCRSTSCRQRADSDTDHVGRVEYRPLLLTQPSSVSWLWSHTHWCPSQRPQEVMRVDGSANPTMPKNPAQFINYIVTFSTTQSGGARGGDPRISTPGHGGRSPTAFKVQALARCTWVSSLPLPPDKPTPAHTQSHSGHRMTPNDSLCVLRQNLVVWGDLP